MPKIKPVSQQRKRRVRMSKAAPFPVPIATVTGETANDSNWIYYQGMMEENGVMVCHSGDMDFLYRMGFFGKGGLSRGQPTWSEQCRVVTLPNKPVQATDSNSSKGWQGIFRAAVMNRRRYMTHLKWRLLAEGDHTALDRVRQDQKYVVEEISETAAESLESEVDGVSVAQDLNCDKVYGEENVEAARNRTSRNTENMRLTQTDWDKDVDADFWGTEETASSPPKRAPDPIAASWDSSHPGDAEFWGTEETASSPPKRAPDPIAASWDSSHPGGTEFWGTENTLTNSVSCLPDNKDGPTAETVHADNSTNVENLEELSCLANPSSKDPTSVSEQAQEQCGVKKNIDYEMSSCDESMQQRVYCNVGERELNHSNSGTLTNLNSSHENMSNFSQSKHLASEGGESVCPVKEYSEFCEDSDQASAPDSQTLFVIPDSDDEDVSASGSVCRVKTKWKPVVKDDPFPVKENLHLNFEEAFFLSYGLGCLSVFDSQQQVAMDLESMWRAFCQRQPQFLPNYIAYHYYRSKNWVPKTGLKFGCSFLLYKDGPPFFHGSYSVVVRFIDTEGKPVEGFGEQRHFSWTSLAGLKRITEHVGKELMFCYIIKPANLSLQEMQSPKCIPQFQVKEMVVSRWVSSQEREGKALEDMP